MKHGMSKSRFYKIWEDMKRRCLNPNFKYYKDYGGRGISVQDSWLNFESFMNNMFESYWKHSLTNSEENTTLDRIDVNGNYELTNCRWATKQVQAKNKRNSKGNKNE